MRTEEFVPTLPRGPLVRHIEQIHALTLHIRACGRAGLPIDDPMVILEHSLREIAVYTQERNPYAPSDPPDFLSAMKKAMANFETAFAKMKAKRTPEQSERLSQDRYEQRIRRERKIGLAFVKAEAARVRKELGLDG